MIKMNKLMNLNRHYASNKNGCPSCNKNKVDTMLPEQSIQTCTDKSCNVDIVNKAGLGIGRKYGNTPSNCKHFPNRLPLDKPYNCCADTNELFNYTHHIDTPSQGQVANIKANNVPKGPEPHNL